MPASAPTSAPTSSPTVNATSLRETARRLWPFFKPHRGSLAGAMLAFLLASLTEPLVPKLLQLALDDGFLAQPSFELWLVPVVLIGLFAVRGVLGYAGQYLLNRATSRAVLGLRTVLADALLHAEAALFSRLPAGVAVSKLIGDPQAIAGHLGGALLTVLRDGTTAVALVGYLFWLNWQLTLLSFVTLPLLMWAVRVTQKRVRRVVAVYYEAQNRLASAAEELVRAWRVIRTSGAVEYERERFGAQAREAQRTTLKAAAAGAAMTPISQIGASLGVALIVTLAMYQVRNGQGTVGSFAGYIAALLLLVSRTRHLSDVSQPVLTALTTAQGCLSLLAEPREPEGGQVLAEPARGDLRLEGVVVRYPGHEATVLRHMDLHIESGTTVALIGSSGGGKSTLTQVLLGLVPCEQGRVLLDGQDITGLNRKSLRAQFAVVSQDVLLFDASVAENVVYAAERDDARLRRCLEAAALWDTVQALPEGLETRLGTNGSRLSGGQRQRLSIARALYREAPIWIFDEATSALDGESESAVLQAILRWPSRRTLILIAHRLSTIQAADRIHVMQGGRVVESGRHAELLARGGAYATAVRHGLGQASPEPEGRSGPAEAAPDAPV